MDLSENRRALLQKYLAGGISGNQTAHLEIPKSKKAGPAPLSYPQQQIWSHSQLAGNALIYNEPITIHRRGLLDRNALERSFAEIVRRHEAWRTVFRWEGADPVQVVQPPPAQIAIPFVDLSLHPDAESEALRLATEDARQPFDLERGPFYRPRLVRLGEKEHRFFLTLHHIIFDGVSLYRVLLPELIACYEASVSGGTAPLRELPIQYSDFARWQRGSPIPDEQLSYWEKTLCDLPLLALPNDHPRSNRQSFAGRTVRFEVANATSAALKSLGHAHGATPFMTMVAAFTALLHGYSAQEDIVIGGITNGRNQSKTQELLGCFLNTIVIRTGVTPETSFIDHLAKVKAAVLGALSHADVPFELLVQKYAGKRDPSRAPFFQTLIVVEPPLESLGEAWDFTHMDVETGTTKFDLQLGLDDRPDGLIGRFTYNRDLFEPGTIERLTKRWLKLLDRVAVSPNESLRGLTTAVFAEEPLRPTVLEGWNGRRTTYPRDATIHAIFEEQVKREPNATALALQDQQLTYEELNRRANQLAWRLRKKGVTRDVGVGIFLDRSIEFIVAVLAILKAGGAYVPLDPSYPAERLALMIEETEARMIVATKKSIHLLFNASSVNAEVLEIDGPTASDEPDANLPNETRAEDLAYIMFTSGSMGRPKGVAVPHRGVVRLVKETDYASFSPNEIFLLLAPISFDASTFEIFAPLLNGGRLGIMPEGRPSLEKIGLAIRKYRVTTLWLTSALFNAMVDERLQDLKPLRQLLTGGDVLSVAHVSKALRALPDTRLINGYGPTENTTFSCCYSIDPGTPITSSVPIGRPIANTTAYILDSHLRPVSVGATGELFLGGDGLARGYWQHPGLTAEKFIADPFSEHAGARLYRTGDLARWLADGTIEFLGRRDTQVKVRGFRIELGEIENALRGQTGVRDAAVVMREDCPNEKQLVGYVIGERSETELLEALQKSLPNYMVPSSIVRLGTFPRTLNGKLDRAALPAPALRQEKTISIFAPRTELEKKLAEIWSRVLGLKEIGTRDNFFELGGHSLLGLRLINQLRQALDEQVSLPIIFEAPTIATMAEKLRKTLPRAVARWMGEEQDICLTNRERMPLPLRRSLPPVMAINRASRRVRRAEAVRSK